MVQAIAHETGQTQSQTYYSGDQESEIPAVRQLLHEQGLEGEKVSLEALHCNPATLEPITQAGGIYLVGWKENQPVMCAAVQQETAQGACLYQTEGWRHGRIAQRKYQVYDLAGLYQDERWAPCDLSTAVSRDARTTGTQKRQSERGNQLLSVESKHQLWGIVRGSAPPLVGGNQ